MTTKLEPQETADGLPYVLGVRKADDDTYEGGCSCGFRTSGWPLKRIAEERIEQHADEHRGEDAPPELSEFMLQHGIASPPVVKDDPFGDGGNPVLEAEED